MTIIISKLHVLQIKLDERLIRRLEANPRTLLLDELAAS